MTPRLNVPRVVTWGMIAFMALSLLGTAAPASAQMAAGRLPITESMFSGTLNDQPVSGTFTGSIGEAQVAPQGEQLYLIGTLTGTLVMGSERLDVPPQPFNAPIVVNTGTQCDSLSLYLGRIALTQPAATIELSPVQLSVAPDSVAGAALSPLLCGITKTLDTPVGALPAVADQLNAVLRLFV